MGSGASTEAKTALRCVFDDFLTGNALLREHHNTIEPPKKKMMVFFSSTFTDTMQERNVITGPLLQFLQDRASTAGVEVTFIDFRYGARDENTSDHDTWTYCALEIERCRRESGGIFFISLQGEKYGYCPLPKYIDKASFDERVLVLAEEDPIRKMALEWYCINDNNIPARYRLQPIEDDKADEYWQHVLPTLGKFFEGLSFDRDNRNLIIMNFPQQKACDQIKAGHSVTEWELLSAFNGEENLEGKVHWFRKQYPKNVWPTDYDGTDKSFPYHYFNDTACPKIGHCCNSEDRDARLKELLKHMEERIPSNQIALYDVNIDHLRDEGERYTKYLKKHGYDCERSIRNNKDSNDIETLKKEMQTLMHLRKSFNDHNDHFSAYIEQFSNDLEIVLVNDLDKIVKHRQEWDEDACGLGISGFYCEEILHHYKFAKSKTTLFTGRKELLQKAMDRIYDDRIEYERMETHEESKPLKNICLCILGESGLGKTSFMAKLAEMVTERDAGIHPPRATIVRFLGTSNDSTDGYSLVFSLCLQLHGLQSVYRKERDIAWQIADIPRDYEGCVSHLHTLLATIPVVLILDSLDQLSNDHRECSELSFLKGVRPHQHSRIIVSTLAYDSKYRYKCEIRLKKSGVQCLSMSPLIVDNDSTEAEKIVRSILSSKGRSISEAQWNHFVKVTTERGNEAGHALFLSLSTKVMTKWQHFDDPTSLRIEVGIQPLINQIYDEIEENYGQILVRAMISYIALSERGIDDQEMQDLLSLNDAVLNDVFQYSTPSALVIPMHVWLRVKSSMEDLLVSKSSGCMTFYHRQLREVAMDRMTIEQKKQYSTIMAKYFGNLYSEQYREERLVSANPLLLTRNPIWSKYAIVNERRVVEASKHMIDAGMFEEAAKELCNIETVFAAARVNAGFLVSRRLLILRRYKDHLDAATSTRVYHFMRWVVGHMNTIHKRPRKLIPYTLSKEPIESMARQDYLNHICRQTDHILTFSGAELIGGKMKKNDLWFQENVFTGHTHFSPCLSTLEGHERGCAITYCTFSHDENTIASAASDNKIIVWDSHAGSEIITFVGHTHNVRCVQYSPDDSSLVSSADDGTIRFWSMHLDSELMIIEDIHGANAHINCVAYNSTGAQLVSCASDKNVKVLQIVDIQGSRPTWSLLATLKGHTYACLSCRFDGTDSWVASCGIDDTLMLWPWGDEEFVDTTYNSIRLPEGTGDKVVEDIRCHESITRTLSNDAGDVRAFDFNIDDSQVACGTQKKGVAVWSWPEGKLLHEMTVGSSNRPCNYVHYSQGHLHRLVVGTEDVTDHILIFDTLVGQHLATLSGHNVNVTCVKYSGRGHFLVSGSGDSTLKVWSHNEDALISNIDTAASMVTCLDFDKVRDKIITGSTDHSVKMWDIYDGRHFMEFPRVHTADITSVAVAKDGSFAVSGGYDKKLIVYDLGSKSAKEDADDNEGDQTLFDDVVISHHRITDHGRMIGALAISPNGKQLIVGSVNTHFTHHALYDGEVLAPNHHTSPLSPNPSRRALSSKEGASEKVVTNLACWVRNNTKDTEEGEESPWTCTKCYETMVSNVHYIDFRPDGSLIAVAADDGIRIYDNNNGSQESHTSEEVAFLGGHNGIVLNIKWSADGSKLVSASEDGTARVWEGDIGHSLGAEITCFKEHMRMSTSATSPVESAAWCIDDEYIISGSSAIDEQRHGYHVLLIWHSISKQVIRKLIGTNRYCLAIKVGPVGEKVYTGSGDNTLRVWRAFEVSVPSPSLLCLRSFLIILMPCDDKCTNRTSILCFSCSYTSLLNRNLT